MKRLPLLLVPVGLAWGLLAVLPGPPPARGQDAVARGLQLYQRHCAICHGDQGGGDGPASYLMSPKPRDFTRGEFRLVTTKNGAPTTDDLLRVLGNGMPGSAMPPWDRLSEEDRKLLAGTVKGLWMAGLVAQYRADGLTPDEVREYIAEDTTPGDAVAFDGELEATLPRIARGRVVYTQACAGCHGPEGRGETTQRLLDSRGDPAPARDFTKGIFKGGGEARQIYTRLRAGMRGTAMPTFGDGGLSEEEAWAVAHYIRTLFPPSAQERQVQRTQHMKIRRVTKLPEGAEAWWTAVPPAYVALMPLWWRDDRTEGLLVQAVHDGTTLALRMVWEDPTEDWSNLKPHAFHDGAAVELSWDKDPPFFGMGDKAAAVTLWSWKASWQRDTTAGFADLETAYPHMHLDTYFPVQKNVKAGERPSPDAAGAPHFDPTFMGGWGAGNPVSTPDRPSTVEVLHAKGQGTTTTQEREAQVVQGKGAWDRGVWTLELRAAMAPEKCRGMSAAFAVWNGSQNDRNGQKSVSIWHYLDLEE